jgi:DNA-binding transcriptional MerR regulator
MTHLIHDPLVTTSQAAQAHGVAPATIRSWANRGLLTPARRDGRTPLYRLSDVDEAEYLSRTRDTTGRTTRRIA